MQNYVGGNPPPCA